MQKIVISLFSLFIFSTTIHAQLSSFEFGVKAGGTFGKIDGESFKQGYNFGVNAGFFAYIGSNKVGVQPEVLFNQTKTTVEDDKVSPGDVLNQGAKGHLNYLSIPILLRYNVVNILSLQAGPQFGILMNKNNNLVQNGRDAFKGGDFAIDLGVQLNLNKLKVYGRYNIGLSNISDVTSSDKWTNQQFQVGIGFRLL
ncbi:MAG: porin family protein [Arachidicoccus sp.]|nr:porin family protein [Arachidicoccus sp.]